MLEDARNTPSPMLSPFAMPACTVYSHLSVPVRAGCAPLYHASNPFDWMNLISMQGKTNFFERRVGEYQKAGVMSGSHHHGEPGAQRVFALDADF